MPSTNTFVGAAPLLVDGFTQETYSRTVHRPGAISISLSDSQEAQRASAEPAHQIRTQATGRTDASIESVESYEVVLTAKAAT
jgi:hypothetical protein